ncbi:MAG: nucleotidyltransferase domain-containing protein [Acidobacteriia bacterium]|nr:nucleotidyltransferase domain-containing protein [Terriglobia bacterium]
MKRHSGLRAQQAAATCVGYWPKMDSIRQSVNTSSGVQLEELVARVRCECARSSEVIAAYVYGSVLREDFVPGQSDIDVLLVVQDLRATPPINHIRQLATRELYNLDLTILTRSELEARIHPGWSRHYFLNVRNSGVCVHGTDILRDVSLDELSFAEAFRRLVQMTQRTRFVLVNERKEHETSFWLRKYQYWIPLCLMELLVLHGAPEYRVRMAHSAFVKRFSDLPLQIAYPYESLADLQTFLEHLTIWARDHQHLFVRAQAEASQYTASD